MWSNRKKKAKLQYFSIWLTVASLFSLCFVLECYFAVLMGWVLLGLGFLCFVVSLNFCIYGNNSEGRKGRFWKVGEP